MSLSRKHYIGIAQAVRSARIPEPSYSRLVDALCDYLRKDNPRFDSLRFADACGEAGPIELNSARLFAAQGTMTGRFSLTR